MADSILTVTIQKMAGEAIDRIINLRPEIQNIWRAGVDYALNAYVRPVNPNGFDYKATAGGRSEDIEPRWPTVAGQTVIDGSITWTCFAPSTSSCDPLTGSATATPQSGNTLAVMSTDPNGDIVVRCGGGTTGTDYVNILSVGTVGGQTINVRVVVQVRG